MEYRYKSTLAACCLLGVPFAVSAQSTGEQTAENGPIVLGEILVRGDKIDRNLRDTTAGTTVIPGGEANRSINNDIDQVLRSQPNVLANEGFSLPSIRGIDSTGGARPGITVGSQPRTPVLVDDVATPSGDSSTISQLSLWDVSSIEVARGPQPTSTGRNAFGGAIRVYTNDPVFTFEGAVRAGYFTADGTVNGAFMVNVPVLEDQLAIRITGEGSIGESYVDIDPILPAGFDPEDEVFNRLRGKLLFEPAALEDFSLLLTVDRTRKEAPLEGFVTDVEDIRIDDTFPFALRSSYEEVDQITTQAKATYDVTDNISIVGRAAWQENELLFVNTGEDFFGSEIGSTGFDKRQFEVEGYVQVQNIGILERGVFGVIHNTEDEEGFGNGFFDFTIDGKIQNTGIYGEVELSADALVRDLTVIAGGRLEIDDRTRSTNSFGFPASDASFNETVFLPKAGLRYDVDEVSTVGYTYSRGFRNGGLDLDFFAFPIATSVIEPEYIDQHEIFARTSFLDNRLELSAAAFYYDWEDAQVPGASAVIDSNGARLFGNVPEAIGYGAEISAAFWPVPEVRLDGALGLLRTEITDAGAVVPEFEGDELPRAPNMTASMGLTLYPFEGFEATATISYVGSTRSALGEAELDSYALVDLSASYEIEAGPTAIVAEAFISNLTDERYVTFDEALPAGFGGGSLRAVGRPRTFGAAVTFEF
ncbi:MAG: TonB-dependent receptor [Pseudomonadota bacterium]